MMRTRKREEPDVQAFADKIKDTLYISDITILYSLGVIDATDDPESDDVWLAIDSTRLRECITDPQIIDKLFEDHGNIPTLEELTRQDVLEILEEFKEYLEVTHLAGERKFVTTIRELPIEIIEKI